MACVVTLGGWGQIRAALTYRVKKPSVGAAESDRGCQRQARRQGCTSPRFVPLTAEGAGMLKSDLIEKIAAQNPHLYRRDAEKTVNTDTRHAVWLSTLLAHFEDFVR